MKPPPISQYPHLERFRHESRCSYCGARQLMAITRITVYQWGKPTEVLLRCLRGCAVLQRPEHRTYETWRQTGAWRFKHHQYSSLVEIGERPFNYRSVLEWELVEDPYIFTIDAGRCDFCSKAVLYRLAGVCVKRVNGVARWLIFCKDCEDRARAHENRPVPDEPLNEPPEFPVYVGWDGQEHGEY